MKAGLRPFLAFGRRAGVIAASLVGRLNLILRFALVCLVILVAGAVIIGRWVAGEIESGVIHRTATVTALYVDSVIRPHLGGLASGAGLDAEATAALGSLLQDTPLGEKIVSFKVWSTDGEIVFATLPGQQGLRFEPDEELLTALGGRVDAHLSKLERDENSLERRRWGTLVEIYAPTVSEDGRVFGVVEFYQLPDDLLEEVHQSQRRGWLIVGSSTVVMYLLLVGLVAGASATITRQNRSLKEGFAHQLALEQRVRGLNQQLARAAADKAETDERVLHRIGQDLHDGPAQDLALAMLRFDNLRHPGATEEEQEALETVQYAVQLALDQVRSISTGLHLPELEGLTWRETVEKAVREHYRKTGSEVHFEADDIDTAPSSAQRIGAYRFVQEALSNSSRHSGEAEQWVSLVADGSWATIRVKDAGRGFDIESESRAQARRPRLGLQGMRERTELLGGTFRLTSRPGHGTIVESRIPLVPGGENAW